MREVGFGGVCVERDRMREKWATEQVINQTGKGSKSEETPGGLDNLCKNHLDDLK